MLEALLFAAGVTTAAANVQAKPEAAPSVELLEFVADWSEPEAHQILDTHNANSSLPALDKPVAHSKQSESRNER